MRDGLKAPRSQAFIVFIINLFLLYRSSILRKICFLNNFGVFHQFSWKSAWEPEGCQSQVGNVFDKKFTLWPRAKISHANSFWIETFSYYNRSEVWQPNWFLNIRGAISGFWDFRKTVIRCLVASSLCPELKKQGFQNLTFVKRRLLEDLRNPSRCVPECNISWTSNSYSWTLIFFRYPLVKNQPKWGAYFDCGV